MQKTTRNSYKRNGKYIQDDQDKRVHFDFSKYATLHSLIEEFRKFSGISYRKLGEELGVSYQVIHYFLHNRRIPKICVFKKICKNLGLSEEKTKELYINCLEKKF